MAESAIGAAGLALAVPGVIDVLIRYGAWIGQRIDSFQNAKGVWADLGEFGWSLSRGELNVIILAAKSFYLEEGCDLGLKNSLKLQIGKLKADVDATKAFLEQQNPKNIFARTIFAISGERRAKELNRTLALDKQSLAQILTINDIRTRRTAEPLLLAKKRFSVYQNCAYKLVQGSKNLFMAQGDYSQDPLEVAYEEVKVLVERPSSDTVISEVNLKDIAGFLSYRLSQKGVLTRAESSNRGLLRCLGYRMEPSPELVFALPQSTRQPQTLRNLIASKHAHPLDFRFQLARKLSEAVLEVAAARLVHKSIRTETILIVEPTGLAEGTANDHFRGFGDVFLTTWSLLRDVSGQTLHTGGSQWAENLYRHPKRQGLDVQERYNMGHDIYSLGVCLLEIGLWELLFDTDDAVGQPRLSEVFRNAAGVSNGTIPTTEAELNAKLRRPSEIKTILLSLAEDVLPQRVGLRYQRLVTACLTALDQPSGLGPEIDFAKMSEVDRGVAFRDHILSFLTEMSI